MQDQDPALLEEFVVENSQNLEIFEQDLLALEETGVTPELINKMFRAIHSMKGSSGYLGLDNILEVSHLGETLLDQVRKDERELTAEITDVLLKTTDALRAMVESSDLGASYDTSMVLSLLQQTMQDDPASAPAASQAAGAAGMSFDSDTRIEADVLSEIPPEGDSSASGVGASVEKQMLDLLASGHRAGGISDDQLKQELRQGKMPYWICVDPEQDDIITGSMTEVGVLAVHEEGAGKALILTVLDEDMLACSANIKPDQMGAMSKTVVCDVLEGKSSSGKKAAPVAPPAVKPAQSVPVPAAAKSAPQGVPVKKAPSKKDTVVVDDKPASKRSGRAAKAGADDGAMIKIHARFLDQLLRLTGNMVMSRNQLLTRYDFADDSAFATLSQAITEVHRGVVQTRMNPVSSLFDRFRRVVRDLSHQLDKNVELRTEGGEMELDRTILEAFVDPLTHMIRNSLDHGIETAQERQVAAKPHMATITLKAYQESGEIIIAVCDDGRGVDIGRVKGKALEKGIITPTQAESMPDNKAVLLIFEPGFSTAEKLSAVSGRGVGMDVVRTNIEAIGGVIDCQTEMGRGTTIQARLPLTKAMVASSLIAALVVRVSGHRFCIPQSAVNELIRVSESDRHTKIRILQGQEVFQHRELVVPIIPLASALGVHTKEAASDAEVANANSVNAHAVASGGARHSGKPAGKQNGKHGGRHTRGATAGQTLIVLQHRQNLVGMIVDEIIGIEEAVVRELPKLASGSNVFSGHTVLGDGQVVMLVDIGGVVERMNMKFNAVPQKMESKLPALSVGKRSDLQTMIIFNYSEEEYFAVPLELVSLVEKIKASDIRRVGDRCYYPFKGNTIPLLYLDKHLPISKLPRDLEYYNLILPARVKFPIGLLTNFDIAVHDISEKFDSKITHDKGVLGTFMHGGKLVMLLDLYALFEHDDPDNFDTSGRDTITPARILIVEDSLFYRKLNSTYLSGPGRDLTIVNDGREALLNLRQNPTSYDMVVTDIEMPNMDGFGLVKAIRGDPLLQELPVIALTALQDSASRERGMRLGFDEYVVKVDKDSLTRCVELFARKIETAKSTGVNVRDELASTGAGHANRVLSHR